MSLTRDEILAGPQSIPSDPHVVADFCLIPFPTTAEPTVSVSPYIAIVQQTLDKAKKEGRIEGYLMHSYGTNLEGTWDNVMTVLKECHLAVHKRGNIWRVATDLRIGTRLDKQSTMAAKVSSVNAILEKKE